MTAQILSRTRLERLIDQYGLYKDDGVAIMQERVDRMRRDIAIEFAGDQKAPGRFITVAFSASDPKVAQRVASEVAGYVVSQSTVDMMSANDGTLQFLTAMIEEAKRKLDQFDQAHPAGHAESRSATIEREVLEEGYRSLLRRQQDAFIVSAIDNRQFGEQLKVIDPAHIPERPTGLSHAQMTGAGVLGGLLVGLLLVGVSSKRA